MVAIFPMQTMVPALTFSPANFTKLNDIPFYFEVKADCRLYLSLSCFNCNYNIYVSVGDDTRITGRK